MSEPTAEEYVDIGRRAVACSAWLWRKRMLTTSGWTVVGVDGQGLAIIADRHGSIDRCLLAGHIPDLSDAATRWLVLELVREKVPGADLRRTQDGFSVYDGTQMYGSAYYGVGRTEAHALVAALEAVSG